MIGPYLTPACRCGVLGGGWVRRPRHADDVGPARGYWVATCGCGQTAAPSVRQPGGLTPTYADREQEARAWTANVGAFPERWLTGNVMPPAPIGRAHGA